MNQLFFGEIVTVIKKKDEYLRVMRSDKYSGWVDNRFISAATRLRQYSKKLNRIVVRPQLKIYDRDKQAIFPYFLYYGTRLCVTGSFGGRANAVLPDGSKIFLSASGLKPINRWKGKTTDAQALVRDAIRFLGTPYLWGGISPAGFDCSGFIQTLFARFNMPMPRDTKDQIRVGRRIERHEAKAGDLMFFNRHVGLVFAKNRIIHSSLGGGGVRNNSLRSGMPDFRADLDSEFKTARRII